MAEAKQKPLHSTQAVVYSVFPKQGGDEFEWVERGKGQWADVHVVHDSSHDIYRIVASVLIFVVVGPVFYCVSMISGLDPDDK